MDDERYGCSGNAGQAKGGRNVVSDQHVAQIQGDLVARSKHLIVRHPVQFKLLQGVVGAQGSKEEPVITVMPLGVDKLELQTLQIQVRGLNRLSKKVQVDPC